MPKNHLKYEAILLERDNRKTPFFKGREIKIMKKVILYSVYGLIMFIIFSLELTFIGHNFSIIEALILSVTVTLCTVFADYAKAMARKKLQEKQMNKSQSST
jgi:hypothetical protein